MYTVSNYRTLKSTGSLKAFYDDIVYWEIAKNNNRFYVTFMKGEYAIPNNLQESIGTMEIGYPHTTKGNASTSSFSTGFNRVNAQAKAFMQNDETGSGTNNFPDNHNYNGFIPITELNGVRYYDTLITSSNTETRTYNYEVYDAVAESVTVEKTVEAAYFYPFSSHQLSVLRDEPTLVINMDKESELGDGLGDSGFVVIPQNCHPKVKNNVEYYLEKVGLIPKTTKHKNQSRRR
jgi:hypothetical protein